MILFYVMAQLTTLSRSCFYLSEIANAKLVVIGILTVLPGILMLGMTFALLNIYV